MDFNEILSFYFSAHSLYSEGKVLQSGRKNRSPQNRFFMCHGHRGVEIDAFCGIFFLRDTRCKNALRVSDQMRVPILHDLNIVESKIG